MTIARKAMVVFLRSAIYDTGRSGCEPGEWGEQGFEEVSEELIAKMEKGYCWENEYCPACDGKGRLEYDVPAVGTDRDYPIARNEICTMCDGTRTMMLVKKPGCEGCGGEGFVVVDGKTEVCSECEDNVT